MYWLLLDVGPLFKSQIRHLQQNTFQYFLRDFRSEHISGKSSEHKHEYCYENENGVIKMINQNNGLVYVVLSTDKGKI